MSAQLTVNQLVGRNVRDLRRALGMTQAELGKAMTDGFGFKWENDQVVASAELGKRRFQLDEVLALAAYFDVSPVALCTAPGGDSPADQIQTNGRRVPMDEYRVWWHTWFDRDPSSMSGADRVVAGRGLTRPWAVARRKGQPLPQAYMDERTRRLTDREENSPKARPGPTVEPATAGPVRVGTTLAPWAQQDDNLVVPANGRFVARDEVEREHVERMIAGGQVRVVDRRSRHRKTGE